MAPGLVGRSAGNVVADLFLPDSGRGRQCAAFSLRKGCARQILLHSCARGDDDRLTAHHQRCADRAVGDVGQLEIDRCSVGLGPVEDVLDRTGAAQFGAGGKAQRIAVAGAGIAALVGLEDVVDHAVAFAVAVGKAGVDAHDPARIERDLAAPCAVVAVTGLGLDAQVFRRLARDEGDAAAGRVAAEQRALRPAQHFDAFDVHHVERAGARTADVDAIDIEAIGGVEPESFAGRGGDTADRDHRRAAAGGTLHDGDVGGQTAEVAGIADAELFNLFGAERADGDGDILQVLFTLLRGHHDFAEAGIIFGAVLCQRRAGDRDQAGPQQEPCGKP